MLWGAPHTEPVGGSAASQKSLPSETPEPSRAQSLYDRLSRVPQEGVDHLQGLGISPATAARTGIRWSGDTGGYARHLVFPLRLKDSVVQLQFWPLKGIPPRTA